MLLDLLSSSNQLSFNIKVAQLVGLHSAIYLSELMAINEKAIRKNKTLNIDGLDFFKVDRKYIAERTTITIEEQYKLDINLNKTEIIKICTEDTDTIYVDINMLCVLLGGKVDESIISNIKATNKKKGLSKEEKAAMFKQQRLDEIRTTSVPLREAYADWIEAGLNRYGASKFSKVVVRNCEQQVDNFAQGNLNVALAIIKGNYQGYNTMKYSIDNYLATHSASNAARTTEKVTVLKGEVF